MTYVLEKIINLDREGEHETWPTEDHRSFTYSIKYPSMWDKYIIFHRNARTNGIYTNFVNAHRNATSISMFAMKTVNVYVYRPIVDSDRNKSVYVNIYNENGSLFYSSSSFPLRIKDIITGISYDGVNEGKPDYRSGYQNCMVLTYLSAIWEYSFAKTIFGYGASNDGYIARSWDNAALGGGTSFTNDFGCVVAYAPDAYPRWK
ncbi:hypothetical protein QE177_04705 [Arsenophonus sp. aPb]|uniref:hypothetical protein n=1 Tax=Arsenophonus sp. aPb TaxID=3041619 RepID=UPI002468D982|nr:hypothetical protein [Arsenophonus sp. aPb]WGL97223.1 hypothetical protein QE177_08250 [Arsenophonus sp. aPb]WGL99186.1 hypothetical protein QE177_04705 [Arsenophonus sp. aPb]